MLEWLKKNQAWILAGILLVVLMYSMQQCGQKNREIKALASDTLRYKKEIRTLYVERDLICQPAIEEERRKLALRLDSVKKYYASIKVKIPKPVVIERPVIVYKDQPYPRDSGVVISVDTYKAMIAYQDSLRRMTEDLIAQNEGLDVRMAMMKAQVVTANLDASNARDAADAMKVQVSEKDEEIKKIKKRARVKSLGSFLLGVIAGRFI